MLKKFKRNFKKQQISNLKAIAFKFEKSGGGVCFFEFLKCFVCKIFSF